VACIVRNIMGSTRTGSIILEHDGGGNRAQTVAVLKIVLPRFLDPVLPGLRWLDCGARLAGGLAPVPL
jgi:hypothetical protein